MKFDLACRHTLRGNNCNKAGFGHCMMLYTRGNPRLEFWSFRLHSVIDQFNSVNRRRKSSGGVVANNPEGCGNLSSSVSTWKRSTISAICRLICAMAKCLPTQLRVPYPKESIQIVLGAPPVGTCLGLSGSDRSIHRSKLNTSASSPQM